MTNEASRFTRACRSVKTHSMAFIIGAAVVAYGGHNYVLRTVEHFQNVATQNLCGNRDPEGTFYWAACGGNPDAEIQASVFEGKDTADILADMRRKQNGGRR